MLREVIFLELFIKMHGHRGVVVSKCIHGLKALIEGKGFTEFIIEV